MMLRSVLAGIGTYLPERVLTNAELAGMVETSDEWIVERTGIRERHIAQPGENTSDLAIQAARKAMAMAGIGGAEIDMLILATTTPDNTFPATATRVQSALGMTGGAAFDIQAVCSGFIYALTLADNFIKLGQAKTCLVIGAETFSRLLDWNDRGTCVLFGDGAGAAILRAEEGAGTGDDRGILSTHIHSDGRHYGMLQTNGGPSSTGTVGQVTMAGREVFRFAVEHMAEVVGEALAANNLVPSDLNWVVPHQANRRIIDGVTRKLNLPAERVICTVERHANTSAASVPLALGEAMADGRIRAGDLVLLEAMGGGFTWGAALLRI